MASYILIRHNVRDFPTWKSGYDAHHPSRANAGLTEKYLLRSAADLDRAKAFTESAELADAMAKAGVVGTPDTYFLTD